MPDDVTTTTAPAEVASETASTETAPPPPGDAPDVKRMIEEAVKKAMDGIYAEARRNVEGKAPKGKKAATPNSENGGTDLASQVASLSQAQEILTLVTENGLNPSQRDLMVAHAKGSADPIASAKEWLVMSNLGKKSTQVTATPGPHASNAGAPAATSMQGPGEDPLKWTEADMHDFMKRTGKMPVPHRPHDIRNREALREVRRAAESALANVRIQLGPRR